MGRMTSSGTTAMSWHPERPYVSIPSLFLLPSVITVVCTSQEACKTNDTEPSSSELLDRLFMLKSIPWWTLHQSETISKATAFKQPLFLSFFPFWFSKQSSLHEGRKTRFPKEIYIFSYQQKFPCEIYKCVTLPPSHFTVLISHKFLVPK